MFKSKAIKEGFTLIELLIVVAIIAILAAIAVPNFLEAQTRAKVSRVKSDMRTITTAAESYFIDNNSYPPGFGLSVQSNDRWRFGLWLLSSPIAYVSSGNFQDPMETRYDPAQGQHPTESTIQYNAMVNDPSDGRKGIVLSEFLRFTGRYPTGVNQVEQFGTDDLTGDPSFRLQPGIKPTWYTLFSNGPDRNGGFGAFDAQTNPEGDVEIRILESDDNPGDFVDVIYNASNGTISTGNIWRAGGGDLNTAGRLILNGDT